MLRETISLIKPLDQAAIEKCQLRLDNLTKPLGCLYSFEYLACKIAGITGMAKPKILRKSIVIMVGDHGLYTQGISALKPETTVQTVEKLCKGCTPVQVFASHAKTRLMVADLGAVADLSAISKLGQAKIASGTRNLLCQPAMTEDETLQAIKVGMKIANEELAAGVNVFGLGAVGAAAAVPSAAIVACCTAQKLSKLFEFKNEEDGFSCKLQELEAGIIKLGLEKDNPLELLRKAGGYEIAGLVGVILGAAAGKTAVVLDGLVTSTAALIAIKIAPQVKDYLIGSHFSVEPAHRAALTACGIPAYLQLDMNIGDGTGALLGISLIEAALYVLNDMKTFCEAEIAVAQDGPGALKQSQNNII